MEEIEVMIDTETLGLSHDAVIMSIGAVKFDTAGNILERFYQNVDPKSCLDLGMTTDQSTIEFWQSQPKEIRQALRVDMVPIKEALCRFVNWFGRPREVWYNGSTFDHPKLETAFKKVGMDLPFEFWQVNDMRTMVRRLGLYSKYKEGQEARSNYHHALADAEFQAKFLTWALYRHGNQ